MEKMKNKVKEPEDVDLLFRVVDDFLSRAIKTDGTCNHMDDEMPQVDHVIPTLEKLSFEIDRTSYEIAYRMSGEENLEIMANELLGTDILKVYKPSVKLLLILVAFALNYGEPWHLTLTYTLSQLKEKQSAVDLKGEVRDRIDSLFELILEASNDVFKSKKIAEQLDNQFMEDIVKLIIMSVIACKSEITMFINKGYESWRETRKEPPKVAELKNKYVDLMKQKDIRQENKEYERLVKVCQDGHSNNMEIIRALIYDTDDHCPLFDGSSKKNVAIDVLEKKWVLLLLSDLDHVEQEIFFLPKLYHHTHSDHHPTSQEREFEVVWLPIVDKTIPADENMEKRYKELQDLMPWYTLVYHSLIGNGVIKFVKEIWQFEKKPITVTLNPQGKVEPWNALHMIRIWGFSKAFPFTKSTEQALWEKQKWTLELLVDSIHEMISKWISERKLICLYGGVDVNWIKKFIKAAHEATKAAGQSLEMIYVGKSDPNEEVKEKIDTISAEEGNRSHSLQELDLIRYFWVRLESMHNSRKQFGRTEEDDMALEIMTMLGFGHNEDAWALFTEESSAKMVKAKGHAILTLLEQHMSWKEEAEKKGFLPTLHDKLYLKTLAEIPYFAETRYFAETHIDSIRVLRALIYNKDDLLPLVDGANKTRVHLDVLRHKMVLLLISDLDISEAEVVILDQLYNESRQQHTNESQYEVVWLPIVDPSMPWTEDKQNQFEVRQASMPWHTVYHPSLLDRAVIRFIREEWQFDKKPILVVLDPLGKVVCPNALHMMWIWGSSAYPFSTAREEGLWREETWRLELLVDGIDPVILTWMLEEKYICLYGGEDLEWIRKFTTAANAVARAAGIDLGMVYVGKSNPKERIRRNNEIIAKEKLSYILQDLTLMWFFWVRLERMWFSKFQLGRTVENDHIMQEIVALMSYDSSEEGWAIFGRGSAEMTRAKGDAFLSCLQEFNAWKDNVELKGFLPAMSDNLMKLNIPHHCNRLVLPGTAGKAPDRVICSDCGRVMEKFVFYRCCDD